MANTPNATTQLALNIGRTLRNQTRARDHFRKSVDNYAIRYDQLQTRRTRLLRRADEPS